MVMIVMLALSVTATDYDFKCPDTPHRKLRAKGLCNSTRENYSCLLDIQRKKFKESCNLTSDFVRPGQKYVISGRRMNTNCSNVRYQPFKLYSSELSKCAFVKTPCSEEGQIIISEGSTKEDRNCRCDYTRGYAFLSRPVNQCFCTPVEADCSCYIVNCLKNNSLSFDYTCEIQEPSPGICQPIMHKRHRQNTDIFIEHIERLQNFIGREKRNLTVVIVIVIITVIVISVFISIVIDLENVISILRQHKNVFCCICCKKKCLPNDLNIAETEDDSSCKKEIFDRDIDIADANDGSSCTMEDWDTDLDITDAKHETDSLQTATYDESCDLQSETELLTPEEHIDIVRQMYEFLQNILQMVEFNKDLQDELSEAYPNANYMIVLNSSKRDLVRNDCGIVITGETSAGKTTLINKFVGMKIFPTNNVAATATVCRIRNSTELMLKAYTKDECLLRDDKFENKEQMKSVIRKFTDIRHIEKDMKDKVYYVDVFLPVPILQGNVIMVNTPGIGESGELDNILLDFLPQAVSFIFIVNARNAGGIHEDRLSRIFKNILLNIENMPCFDPREVFFLTNQWDIVDEDDDDEDDDHLGHDAIIEAGSRTWTLILNKLKKGWPEVEDNRIFQISLKPDGTKHEEKYKTEFQKFETKLTETIIRNQNKRVEFYLSFLQNFVRNAGRGIAARLKLLANTKEEHITIIQRYLERIEGLEADTIKYREKLISYKKKLLSCLVDMLFEYLHLNTTKSEILDPTGLTSIENISTDEVESTIKSRLNSAIVEWFNNAVIKEKMEEANTELTSAVKAIKVKMNNIEFDMTGIKPEPLLAETIKVSTFYSLFRSKMPMMNSRFVRIVELFDEFSKEYILGTERLRIRAEKLYQNVLESITKEKLESLFENFFGEHYVKTISQIFDSDIPNEIKSMRKTNERMTKELLSLGFEHESVLKLNTMMEKLKDSIRIYQDTKR